jgi:hypothetical protein
VQGLVRPLDPAAQHRVAEFLGSPDFDGWSRALAQVGNCVKPIRLVGSSQTIDASTGEVVGAYASSEGRSG